MGLPAAAVWGYMLRPCIYLHSTVKPGVSRFQEDDEEDHGEDAE
jgi:hypothetical protein